MDQARILWLLFSHRVKLPRTFYAAKTGANEFALSMVTTIPKKATWENDSGTWLGFGDQVTFSPTQDGSNQSGPKELLIEVVRFKFDDEELILLPQEFPFLHDGMTPLMAIHQTDILIDNPIPESKEIRKVSTSFDR